MDQLRKRLSEVESDLRGLREDKAAANAAREAKRDAYAEALESGADTKAIHAEAMEAVGRHGEIEDKISLMGQERDDLLKLLGDRGEKQAPGESSPTPVPNLGWNSAALLGDEDVRSRLASISSSQSKFGTLALGEIASRETLLSDLGGGPILGADVVPPAQWNPTGDPRQGTLRQVPVPALPRKVRDQLSFLNLIPVGLTDGNSVPYTQETPITGTDPSPARETAEGDQKPEGSWITYTDAEAPVRTIAVWLKTRKQALADVPALQSAMDTRLRYMVQKRLAESVLNGDGNGVNLEGILQNSGIGDVAYNASIPASEAILSGITNVYLNDGAADGVVVNPIDWQGIVIAKYQNPVGNAGSFEYVGGGPFGVTPSTLWGVPAIPSQVLTQGDALVADFALGSQLLIREGIQVLLSDSDQDDFIRNRVTMLAEMRAALLVWRPALFQKVNLTA